MFSGLYPQLLHTSGEEKAFSTEYNWSLMKHGILKKKALEFDEELKVWKEVLDTLGSEIVSSNMSGQSFGSLFRTTSMWMDFRNEGS